jgi:hypothetical protein
VRQSVQIIQFGDQRRIGTFHENKSEARVCFTSEESEFKPPTEENPRRSGFPWSCHDRRATAAIGRTDSGALDCEEGQGSAVVLESARTARAAVVEQEEVCPTDRDLKGPVAPGDSA